MTLELKAVTTGRCLTSITNATSLTTFMDAFVCVRRDGQRITFVRSSGSGSSATYNIKNTDGRCLQMDALLSISYLNERVYSTIFTSCRAGTASQQWRVTRDLRGAYTITLASDGNQCLSSRSDVPRVNVRACASDLSEDIFFSRKCISARLS